MKRKAEMVASKWEGGNNITDCRARQRRRIFETLKIVFPIGDSTELVVLQRMTERLENDIFTSSTSHENYLCEVYLKIQAMERRFQTNASNQRQSQVPSPNQPQALQKLLPQNVQRFDFSSLSQNAQFQASASLSPAQNSSNTQQQQLQLQQLSSRQQQQLQLQQFFSQQQQLQSPNLLDLYHQLRQERRLNQWLQLRYNILLQKCQNLEGSIQQQPLQQPQNSNRPLITASAQQQIQQSGIHWSSMQPQQQQQEQQQQQQQQQQLTTTATTTATAIATAGQQQTTTETTGQQQPEGDESPEI